MAQMPVKHYAMPREKYPIFYHLDVQPEVITVHSYERCRLESDGVWVGEMTLNKAFNNPDIEVQDNPGYTNTSMYAHDIERYDRERLIVDGGTLAPQHAGKVFAKIGASRIFLNRTFDQQRTNKGGWEVGDCLIYVIGMDRDGYPRPSMTVTVENMNRKAISYRASSIMDGQPIVTVFKPFAGDDFTKCSIVLRHSAMLGFTSNLSDWEPLDYTCLVEPILLPGVTVQHPATIAPDGTATVTVNVVNIETDEVLTRDCELFLEATGGYLPLTRVAITNGAGSFKVKALGLETGDKFKVKVGFRLMTGLADANFTVS
jgi:hypothetical protein